MNATVLIDYDNLDASTKRFGPNHALEHVTARILEHTGICPMRIHLRLYGGWYHETTPTRAAQEISTSLLAFFPRVFRWTKNKRDLHRTILQAELAYSLLSRPEHHLLHTYRTRSIRHGIKCSQPKHAGCTQISCKLDIMPTLFQKGKCPQTGCSVKIKSLLHRQEQKLVDVMLATDLLHLSVQHHEETIVVVTSDEDFWPAIQQACHLGENVIHMQAKKGRTTPAMYHTILGSSYKELSF